MNTIRPKGTAYILYLILKFTILLGMMFGSILVIIDKNYWALPLLFVLPLILLILQIREIIIYRIVITETGIYLAANRDLFIRRHKNIKINYKGLKSIQYFLGCGSVEFISSKIVLVYEDNGIKSLNVLRFNDKQVDMIINYIKIFAEKYNNYHIEIKPDEIQKGFKRNYKK